MQDFEKRNNKSPTSEELLDFHNKAQHRVDQYRQLAEQRVNTFINDVLKTSMDDKEKEFNKRYVTQKYLSGHPLLFKVL